MGRSPRSSYCSSSRRTTSSWPTRMTLTPRSLAARTAPSTSAVGAWSPPIASTAMVSIFGRRLFLGHFDDFAALVLPAFGADAVRQFGFVTVRAFRQPGRLQRIVGAAGGGPLVGVSAFRIRHFLKPQKIFDYVNSSLRSAPQRSS